MNVIGFCGPSGVSKTTLIEQLVAELKKRGQRVSVLKHAHKTFEIDYPGKDTWRHRQAGALEVLIASGHRLAKMREYEVPGRPTVHQLIAEMEHFQNKYRSRSKKYVHNTLMNREVSKFEQ